MTQQQVTKPKAVWSSTILVTSPKWRVVYRKTGADGWYYYYDRDRRLVGRRPASRRGNHDA